MRFLRFALVMLGHLAFGGFTYGVWAGGQKFGAEIMMHEAVFPTITMGVIIFWLWYGWWAWKLLRDADKAGATTAKSE